MTRLVKTIRRWIRLRSSDRALPSTVWVLTIGPQGVTFRRKGAPQDEAVSLSWRSIIGHGLIHRRLDK